MILNNRTANSYPESIYCSKLSCSYTPKAKLDSISGSQIQIKTQSATTSWKKIGLLSLHEWAAGETKLLPLVQTMSAHSPCGELFLFILPCFGALHDGRPDQVSFSWVLCGAVLWAAVLLGSCTTCLEGLCKLAASSPGEPDVAGTSSQEARALSPQQRCLGVLSDLPAGIQHAELKSVTSETAWAFPHLTAVCLVMCLLHYAIYSWMFLCTSVPNLIAWCCVTFPFWLLSSCTSRVSEVLYYS